MPATGQLPGERQRFRVLGPTRTYTTSQSWIEVNYGALVGNAATVLQQLPSGATPLAMVQGNGYGHGLDFAAKAFLDAGFKELGVTDINEAITLRQASPLPLYLPAYPRIHFPRRLLLQLHTVIRAPACCKY